MFSYSGCEECKDMIYDSCLLHNALALVRDKVVPTYAVLTLPHFLNLTILQRRVRNSHCEYLRIKLFVYSCNFENAFKYDSSELPFIHYSTLFQRPVMWWN